MNIDYYERHLLQHFLFILKINYHNGPIGYTALFIFYRNYQQGTLGQKIMLGPLMISIKT